MNNKMAFFLCPITLTHPVYDLYAYKQVQCRYIHIHIYSLVSCDSYTASNSLRDGDRIEIFSLRLSLCLSLYSLCFAQHNLCDRENLHRWENSSTQDVYYYSIIFAV